MAAPKCRTHGSRYEAGCEDCRTRGAANQANTRTRNTQHLKRIKGRMTSLHPQCPHGTVNGYDNYRCRCIDCTAANARK